MSEERNEREQWAEIEALQFDKTADSIAACVGGWLKSEDPESLFRAAQVAQSARVWKEAARALRQPYYARLERQQRESY